MKSVLLLALLVASAPAAFAHVPPGPVLTCEDPFAGVYHDYGGPSPGNAVLGRIDGNLADCAKPNPVEVGLFGESGIGCVTLAGAGADPGPPVCGAVSTGIDRPLYDFDGHAEYAIGGAHLSFDPGDGATYGSLVCAGEWGHHEGDTVAVHDSFHQVEFFFFVVTADHSRAGLEDSPDCGDNLVEVCNHTQPPPSTDPFPVNVVIDTLYQVVHDVTENPDATCNPLDQAIVGLSGGATGYAAVQVPFAPGIDGTYAVFLGQGAVSGHVWTQWGGGGKVGPLPTVCPGHGTYPTPK